MVVWQPEGDQSTPKGEVSGYHYSIAFIEKNKKKALEPPCKIIHIQISGVSYSYPAKVVGYGTFFILRNLLR